MGADIGVLLLVICFVCSIRVNEEFMVKLSGIIQQIYDGKGEHEELPHMVIPLLEKFKNESGQRWYLMMAPTETASGFKPRVWMGKLLLVLFIEGGGATLGTGM